ncbi:MAG: hypothetical protein ACKO2K_03825, partial [Alphaproteobacteria bacterium]
MTSRSRWPIVLPALLALHLLASSPTTGQAEPPAPAPPDASPTPVTLLPAPPGDTSRVPGPMPKPGKITVFTAKKIVTMDPANPTATAIAFSNGRILSVGSLDDLKPWLDRYPHEIDRRFEG